MGEPLTKPDVLVFYAGLLYAEYQSLIALRRSDLPDGCYIRVESPWNKNPRWYDRHMTRMHDDDIPANLKLLVLLMGY